MKKERGLVITGSALFVFAVEHARDSAFCLCCCRWSRGIGVRAMLEKQRRRSVLKKQYVSRQPSTRRWWSAVTSRAIPAED